jgi:hypothetical protein
MAPNLILVCVSAFVAVFVLLSILAISMRLILVIFPEKERKTDAALLAAVSTTMQSLYPGTIITKIEEAK